VQDGCWRRQGRPADCCARLTSDKERWKERGWRAKGQGRKSHENGVGVHTVSTLCS
jgi:hypothetical protein